MMRTLILSDTPSTSFNFFREVFLEVKPSLILIAGDLVDDDKSDEGSLEKWECLYELISLFDKSKVQAFFIKGNWDGHKYYDRLIEMTGDSLYVEEISGKFVEFRGTRILGVPYSFTHCLKNAKRISEYFPEPVDIVLAHAEPPKDMAI